MRDLASPGRSRTIPPAVGVLLCRPPAAACADRRSAFPCLRVALPRPKPNHPLRSRGPCLPAACGGLCRPEVGVPLPARRSAPAEAEPSPPHSGSFSAGRLRRPVPTRGRRSLARASLCPGRSRTIPPAVGVLLCRPPAAACADRSRSDRRCLRVALPRPKPNHPPRTRGPSLPPRGVPLPARRSAPVEAQPSPPQLGSFSAGRLRRPVPTGGRRPVPARRSAPAEAEPSPSAKNNGSELCSLPA